MKTAEKLLGEDYQKLVERGNPSGEASYKDKYRSGWQSGVREKAH